jgi:Ni/Co efflux regulator RcnB
MKTRLSRPLLIAAALSIAAINPAFADKPAWAGEGKGGNGYSERNDHGKGGKSERRNGGGKHDDRHDGSVNISIGAYFGGTQRQAVYDYYGPDVRAGHCPPGLAKKNNGCMPPGQAKKWAMGRPLPSDLTYYAVPPTLVARLGPPPAGHKYVRVASDILLITIGTSMVVDAIQDLGNL